MSTDLPPRSSRTRAPDIGLARLSLKRKLMAIFLVTSEVMLVLACGALFAYDLYTHRERMKDRLAVLLAHRGQRRRSLVSGETATVERLLGTLQAEPHIVAACVWNAKGQMFATYVREDATPAVPANPRPAMEAFSSEALDLFRDIRHDDRLVGTLWIQADSREIALRLKSYTGILAIVLLFATMVGVLVSARLQTVVTDPILYLVELQNNVSRRKDYALRAIKSSDDEIGLLVDGFNRMLEQIQARDAELTVARDRAEDASRTKSTFLANMSHELRTPLNAIIGYSEMLSEDARDSGRDDDARDLHKVNTAAKHLLGLINDILDLSKIEAGKMTLSCETFQLAELIAEVETTVRPLVEAKGNTLAIEQPPAPVEMHGDPVKIRQVLLNLLSNAAKFTERGVVSLHVQAEAQGGRSFVQMIVKDSGIGMTEEQMSRLFQPFSQAEASTNRRFGGTGLGLAISRRFCNLMGGTITVESEPGAGSTFTARIPAQIDGVRAS
ncbi:MAG: ATP-binding protein [Acidobacteriota bacterium]